MDPTQLLPCRFFLHEHWTSYLQKQWNPEIQTNVTVSDTKAIYIQVNISGADPGLFLGGGVPLRNGITDWWPDINTSCIRKPQVIPGGGGAQPLHPPPRFAPVYKTLYIKVHGGIKSNLSLPLLHVSNIHEQCLDKLTWLKRKQTRPLIVPWPVTTLSPVNYDENTNLIMNSKGSVTGEVGRAWWMRWDFEKPASRLTFEQSDLAGRSLVKRYHDKRNCLSLCNFFISASPERSEIPLVKKRKKQENCQSNDYNYYILLLW